MLAWIISGFWNLVSESGFGRLASVRLIGASTRILTSVVGCVVPPNFVARAVQKKTPWRRVQQDDPR